MTAASTPGDPPQHMSATLEQVRPLIEEWLHARDLGRLVVASVALEAGLRSAVRRVLAKYGQIMVRALAHWRETTASLQALANSVEESPSAMDTSVAETNQQEAA